MSFRRRPESPGYTWEPFLRKKTKNNMYFISATRLKLRSCRFLIPFLWQNFKINRQIQKTKGFFKGKLLVDKKLTFWTLTVWMNRESTLSFRNSGAHLRAMPKLFNWCDEAAYGHWEEETPELSDWLEIHRRICEIGKLSKVKYPSEAHQKREFQTPRYFSRFEQKLNSKITQKNKNSPYF